MEAKELKTNISLESKNINADLIALCKQVFDDWKDVPETGFKINTFNEGITNTLFRLRVSTDASVKAALVRVYGVGTEKLIDRDAEIKILKAITKIESVGCQLYGYFDNGLVYEFIEGRSLKPKELPDFMIPAAVEMARWHKVVLPEDMGEKKALVWATMNKWLKALPEKYDNPEKAKRFAEKIDVAWIKAELKDMQDKLSHYPVVFSHNDTLAMNLILLPNEKEIRFIDYEYASYNYRAFDIANHFLEWGGFESDYEAVPTKYMQYDFFEAYFNELNGKKPSEDELHAFYCEVSKFQLVSLFFWGIWSLVQADESKIDFDYLEYAITRFEYYKTSKERLMNVK